MFNRFKSALYNAVGVEEDASSLALQDHTNQINQLGLPHSLSVSRSPRDKLQYGRPAFLQLTSPDEVSVTADHALRPIICPRSFLPWHAGYAETVNAGKSKHNEDQSSVHAGYLTRSVRASALSSETLCVKSSSQNTSQDIYNARGPPKAGEVQVNGVSSATATPNSQLEETTLPKDTPLGGSIVKAPSITPITTLAETSSIESGLVASLQIVDEGCHPLVEASSDSGSTEVDITTPVATVNGTIVKEDLCTPVPKVVLKDDILTVTQVDQKPASISEAEKVNIESSPTSTDEDGNQSTMLENSACQKPSKNISENCTLEDSNISNSLSKNSSLEDTNSETISCSSNVDLNSSNANSSPEVIPSTKAAEHNNSDNTPPSSPYFCVPLSEDRLFVDEGNGNISVSLPYYYFSVFDGHAGWGAALYASQNLHQILHSSLIKVIEHIIPDGKSEGGPAWMQQSIPDPSSVVVGALENAFHLMDKKIEQDRRRLGITGGCTACIALFILGKLFVANAGDSRATLCLHEASYPMSFDFTPETENYRIRKLGAQHPELLGGEYNPIEFIRRPLSREVGTLALCRYPYMAKGWVYKRITEDDLKCPLVCGTGKRSRVMATIGVTRGFGDHDLKAQCTNILIKPFLSSEPEVLVLDLEEETLSDTDVLILGTDGLWDITTNDKAVSTLLDSMARSVRHLPSSDPNRHKYRYTSAAQDMVMSARGKLVQHNWRTSDSKHATIDDIAVFVVPLKSYQNEHNVWKNKFLERVQQNSTGKNVSLTNSAADAKLPSRSSLHDQNASLKTLTPGDGVSNTVVEKLLPKLNEVKGTDTKASNSLSAPPQGVETSAS